MRPKSIVFFERLFLAAAILSFLDVAWQYQALRADAIARGTAAAGPLISLILVVVTTWLFWYFIARKAGSVAKWLLVIFTLISLAGIPAAWAQMLRIGPGYLAIFCVAFLLQIAAMALLFRRDAREWFASKGRIGPIDPDVFN